MAKLLEAQTVLKERYTVVSPIGQGGMGAVYRAEDMLLPGRICAVKEIAPSADMSTDLVTQLQEQFRREAEVLARLDHPNLPKVSDYFTQDGREYLIMDFVPGHDLRTLIDDARIAQHPLSEKQVLDWVHQLCNALAYMHAQEPPILHRDIKPSNIKLTPSGFIKLVDFGLVKLLTNDESRTVTVIQGRGTAAYTPLEQYGGDDAHTGIHSDIYALGATLYHLLTGKPPATARERFLNPDALIPPREINSQIAPHIERIIIAALALHPNERPQTIEMFREALERPGFIFPITPPNLDAQEWQTALQANLPLIIALVTLMVLAILITPL